MNHSFWRQAPSRSDFEMNVVSKHPDFDGKVLRKHNLDSIDTVGVFPNEKFEIHFKNNLYEDVSVKISLDGTNILTGKPADLEPNGDAWMCRAGRVLHLKAWVENNAGGASLVFANEEKSVALHTHGDMSHRGIISAAVFTERDRPVRIMRERVLNSFEGMTPASASRRMLGRDTKGGGTLISEGAAASAAPAAASMPFDMSRELSDSREEKSAASVGAGEYVEQRTHTVKGLDNPVLNSIVRVRYLWWEQIQDKLYTPIKTDAFPSGFPASDKAKIFVDLSGVPRVESTSKEKSIMDMRFAT